VKLQGWLVGLLLIVVTVLSCSASAQLAWDPKEFMGVEEITPGMVGYGKTVFHGTKVETFNIEVIGVLKKLDFGFDMILIKVTSGPVVDRKLQTVAGMSGSPIYINDRLIGAYAYGWDFQQEAVAGVTPIANMLECTEPGSVTPPLIGSLVPKNRVITIGKRQITRVEVAANHADAALRQDKVDPTTMVLTPAATPLFVSGLPDSAMGPLQKFLDRYNVRAMEGPGEADGPAPKLVAGSAVAVSLMEGDANLSAVGTVTYVKGDTVLAFGHPLFSLGKIDIAMDAAYVHDIINSSQSSFKMASPMGRVGTATSDRSFALGGKLGQTPNTLPIALSLTDTSRNFGRRYTAEMMNNPDFTPFLLYLYVLKSGAEQMGNLSWDEGTFTARTVISTDKLGDIEQNIVVAPQANPSQMPLGEFLFLTDSLMTNPYEPVVVKRVYLEIRYAPERNSASIEKITPDRPVARPGETVNLTVKIRPYGKPVETQKIAVKVPNYASEPVMAIIIAGGTQAAMLKPLVSAPPTAEEGVRGVVRWLTDNPSAKSLLTAEVFPTPSYGYRGHMLNDVPAPLFDLLQLSEYAGGMPRINLGGGASRGQGNSDEKDSSSNTAKPTTYLTSQPEPYVLTGGQAVLIAIETEENAVHSRQGEFDFGVQMPILSLADGPAPSAGDDSAMEKNYESSYAAAPWFTPAQRARHAILFDSLKTPKMLQPIPLLPIFRYPSQTVSPFSLTPWNTWNDTADTSVEAATPSDTDTASDANDAGGDEITAKPASTTPKPDAVKAMPPKARPSWGLTTRQDFLRGKHLGTSVTSRGRLVLAPTVRTVYQTTDMTPWKIVTTLLGTYVAGWGSQEVVHLTADGKGEAIFPKDPLPAVSAVTGLTGDDAGNLLVATWPDQHVRLIKPDGSLIRDWQLPGAAIWDLAIATDGKRYAACDQGTVYLLRDDADVPLQVACYVPDKQVFTLEPGTNGDVYLATAPRGKVYRLSKDGELHAVYEARGAVVSLAVDKDDNVYVGTSPICRVYRVALDGTKTELMRGMGRGNRHVLALQMVGNDLYAATGPAGGIYRIVNPASKEPEVIPIFAREDLRTGDDEQESTGPESLMVNALTVDATGALLAATSSPGQVLKLEPRTQGTFLSAVLQTPVVSRWGQIDVQINGARDAATVASRSGSTAVPDPTWEKWTAINPETAELTSDPATFAQFRVHLTGTDAKSPALEYVRLYYQPVNQAPTVKLDMPKAGSFLNGTKDIRWEGQDPDGDELVYTVFYSGDDGENWKQLTRGATPKPTPPPPTPASTVKDGKNVKPKSGKAEKSKGPAEVVTPELAPMPAAPNVSTSEVREKSIPWDSRSVPDGTYRIKVIASDKYSKPYDAKTGEAISGRFTVDNTPPTINVASTVYVWASLQRLDVTDNLTPITGGRFRIDDGPWIALTPAAGIFSSKKEVALLMPPDGEPQFTPGEHKVVIQVKDSAENQTERTVSLRIGEKPPAPKVEVDFPAVGPGNDKNLADIMLYPLKKN